MLPSDALRFLGCLALCVRSELPTRTTCFMPFLNCSSNTWKSVAPAKSSSDMSLPLTESTAPDMSGLR
eukprot:jgi/Tetstr1/442777/TSEL_030862.t1